MIPDDEECHYLAVKRLSALLRRITSKHKEGVYCINFFRSYTTKNRLKNIKMYMKTMITAM